MRNFVRVCIEGTSIPASFTCIGDGLHCQIGSRNRNLRALLEPGPWEMVEPGTAQNCYTGEIVDAKIVPCHVRETIKSAQALRKYYPGAEEEFWALEKKLQDREDKSVRLYGTCDTDSPMFGEIYAVMDRIAWGGSHLGLDPDWYCAYFHDDENRHAHGIPRRNQQALCSPGLIGA